MIAMCLKVAGMISQSEELTWQLIDSYGIIEFLEDGGNLISSAYLHLDQARPGGIVGYQYTHYFAPKIPIYLKIVKCVILNT